MRIQRLKHVTKKKRIADLADIDGRLKQIEVERSYRIVSKLEQTAKEIKDRAVVTLTNMIKHWRRRVLILDGLIFGTLAAITTIILSLTSSWDLLPTFVTNIAAEEIFSLIVLGLILGVCGYLHFSIRGMSSRKELKKIADEMGRESDDYKQYAQAFGKCTVAYRSLLFKNPVGWNKKEQQIIEEVIYEANDYIQELNDQFTNPSGRKEERESSV